MRRRVLFACHNCYFDNSNGASVASRAMLECLARHGFAVGATTGTVLESGQDVEPGSWLVEQRLKFESPEAPTSRGDEPISTLDSPTSYRLRGRDVEVVLHRSSTTRPHEPDEPEIRGFLRLFEEVMDRSRPDVVVNYGGDSLAALVRQRSRARGAAVVFALHNFNYPNRKPFAGVDAVIVPSRFAASYYRKALGLNCRPLPNLVHLRGPSHGPRPALCHIRQPIARERGLCVRADRR